jgi:hypothetical protein
MENPTTPKLPTVKTLQTRHFAVGKKKNLSTNYVMNKFTNK